MVAISLPVRGREKVGVGRLLLVFRRRVNLGEQLFIGIVLQSNGPCGTLRVAQTISFTENGIDDSLFALFCLTKLYGTVRTD